MVALEVVSWHHLRVSVGSEAAGRAYCRGPSPSSGHGPRGPTATSLGSKGPLSRHSHPMDALVCIPFSYRIMAAQVDAALGVCGIPAGPLRNALRQQGLDTMDNIRQVLRTDEDVERLARMFSRRPGNRRQELSLLQQINLQALAWWAPAILSPATSWTESL
jgi:hypothetical protein